MICSEVTLSDLSGLQPWRLVFTHNLNFEIKSSGAGGDGRKGRRKDPFVTGIVGVGWTARQLRGAIGWGQSKAGLFSG